MKVKTLFILSLIFLVPFLFNHCTESVKPNTHPGEWMDVDSDEFHGREFALKGPIGIESCKTCHGDNYTGGSSEISCYQCHEGGESGHPEYWMHISYGTDEFHGDAFFDDPDWTDCQQCHGEDLNGGTSETSCYLCHTGGPSGHTAAVDFMNYDSTSFHSNKGNWNALIDRCQNCHGVDLDGGLVNVSCTDCHIGGTFAPHPEHYLTFPHLQFHSSAGDWTSTVDQCMGCHGDNLDGGLVDMSCITCHTDGFTSHAPNFNIDIHNQIGDWVDVNSQCQGCHGENFDGGFVDISCVNCHASDGEISHPDGFAIYGDPNFHSNTGEWDPTVNTCKSCHGENLDGGIVGLNCHDCHADGFTSHDSNFIFEDHNDYGDWTDVASQCQGCHGQDLDGGFVSYSCDICHASDGDISHPDGFMVYGDSNFHSNTGDWYTTIPECQTCHGDNLDGGITGVSCNSCHEDNFTGHPNGFDLTDHTVSGDWNNTASFCMNCHGTDLNGGLVDESCTLCHNLDGSPVIPHLPGIMDYSNQSEFHGINGQWETVTPDCQLCHGDDLSGGLSNESCIDCHDPESPIHSHNYSQSFDPTADEYHGKFLWDNGWNFSYCQNCHGQELDGGIVELTCNNCHLQENNVGYCGNCHGDRFSSEDKFYPPLSIMNEDDPSLMSVGAHEAHMLTTITEISCSQCHIVPDGFMDDGHLGSDNIAEVVFSLNYDNDIGTPSYDPSTGTCSNVYCHGAFSFGKAESINQGAYQDDFIIG